MVEVRCGDASERRLVNDVVPVDIVLLAGVLGNVDPSTVETVVCRVASLLRPGGLVVWTRGGGAGGGPDRRPEVRAVFESSGFEECRFDGAPETFGVGTSRLIVDPPPSDDRPLFTFVR
jgi:hypothetical protein